MNKDGVVSSGEIGSQKDFYSSTFLDLFKVLLLWININIHYLFTCVFLNFKINKI